MFADIGRGEGLTAFSSEADKQDFVERRRGRDSNSRSPRRDNSFQDCPIKPLWYPSALLRAIFRILKNIFWALTLA